MDTTWRLLGEWGRMVDMQPQAMDQTANPELMIAYVGIRTAETQKI
jgi:hypothetical protein